MVEKKLLLVAVALLLPLLVLEIILRVHFFRKDRDILAQFHNQFYPAYGYLGRPNDSGVVHTDEFEFQVRTDARGFRPVVRDLPPSGIVFLGDSFLWGTGVNAADRFSDLCSARLGRRIDNLGLCGAGGISALTVLERFAPATAKTAFVFFFPNDIQNNLEWMNALGASRPEDSAWLPSAIAAKETMPPDDDWRVCLAAPHLRWRSALLFYLRSKLTRARSAAATVSVDVNGTNYQLYTSTATGDCYLAAALTPPLPAVETGWKMQRAAMTRLRDISQARGLRTVVVYIPYQEAIYTNLAQRNADLFAGVNLPPGTIDYNLPARRLRALAEETGLEFLDLTPALRSAAATDADRLYYVKDAHLTPAGHKVVAAAWSDYFKPATQSGPPS